MASFILKLGLVTNDGIDRLKMASIVYENGIDRLRKWHRPFTKGKSATLRTGYISSNKKKKVKINVLAI